MSNIAIKGGETGTGVFTIAAPNGNTNRTLVLPDEAGTMALQGGAGVGKVLQVQSTVLQGLVTGSTNGTPVVITNGAQVFSLSFTPLIASSKLLVQTSSVAISERTNTANICWLALWDGSTYVAANSGTWYYDSFGSSLNAAYTSINELYDAGSTATRNIQIRAGIDSGTVYANGGGHSSSYGGTSAQIRMTVMEIAA